MSRLYVVLFISASNSLCAMMAGTTEKSGEFALCLVSYAVIIPLLALSLMFRFATEASGRKKQFAILSNIGYGEDQIKRIKNMELVWLYGFIMGTALLYIFNIVAVLGIHGLIPGEIGAGILLIFTGSLVVCGIISRRQY